MSQPAILAAGIDRLGLANRIVNALGSNYGGVLPCIETIGQLVSQTAWDLLSRPNIAEASLSEIREKLSEHGLRLANDPEPILKPPVAGLRDYFAGQALVGYLAMHADIGLEEPTAQGAARWAYEFADAMLAARSRVDADR